MRAAGQMVKLYLSQAGKTCLAGWFQGRTQGNTCYGYDQFKVLAVVKPGGDARRPLMSVALETQTSSQTWDLGEREA